MYQIMAGRAQQNPTILYADGNREEGRPSRGLVHPRTRVGGGARWIQVPAVAGTSETMGGAGTERSEVESPWRVSLPHIPYLNIKKRVT